jgi:transposase InsO family protein
LEKLEAGKLVFSVRQSPVRNTKLIKLIGEKPMLHCSLNDNPTMALWDTGAQVSMVSKEWVNEKMPNSEILSVPDFLDGDDIHLYAANSSTVGFEGVVVMDFGIGDNYRVRVPFIVSSDPIPQPIVGYNVIKEAVKAKIEDLSKLLQHACPTINEQNVNTVINVIDAVSPEEEAVKTAKKTVLPPRSRCKVKCRTNMRATDAVQSVVFSPDLLDHELEFAESVTLLKLGKTAVDIVVSNPTNVPQTLEKGVIIGAIEFVDAVTPIHPKEDKELKKESVNVNSAQTSPGEEWLPPVNLDHLSGEQRKMAEKVLREECDVFCRSKEDHGDIPDMEMELKLTDQIPVSCSHRRIPRPLYDEVKNFINDLITNNWIRESKSSYSSPIVCVRKKDQTLRLCIDYRMLNKKIVPDKQPIPKIQELFDSLGGQAYFSTLDMAKAYHQGYVKEEFRKYTAFSTPWALYEWIRIPMGISNAPPVFQRYINQILTGLRDKACVAYLDDILVFGRTFEEHCQNLKLVLARLRTKGVKLRADKCFLFHEEVKYLGRLISKHGHRPDPKDASVLDKFKTAPKNVGELRTLLGFLGYYRQYVKDFAKRFKPIYDLLKSRHVTDKKKTKKNSQFGAKQSIVWTEDLQQVVNETVDYLKSPDFLVFPDFDLPFTVHCDASEKGLGAVLYQNQNGEERVLRFASRTLTDSENNYHLHSGKLEFLALKWSITEKFSDYLMYSPFTVYTDNNPLTYVMTTAKLNATGLRWVAELANYQFKILYRPGKKNGDADGLSRFPSDVEEMKEQCTEELKLGDLASILSGESTPPTCSPCIDVNILSLGTDHDISPIGPEELAEKQAADSVVGPVYRCVLENRKPTKEEYQHFGKRSKTLMSQFSKLKVHEGLLTRAISGRRQLVLPGEYHPLVLKELHEKMGHLGVEKVEGLCRQRFYWPYMKQDIEFHIQKRCSCVVNKRPSVREEAPLFPIVATAPFELVCIDFLKLEICKGQFQYVLLVTDHFTRFAQAYATKNKGSKAAAEKLFNEFIPQFGFPKCIHHDRGREFNSELFDELHSLAGIQMSNTTPYHPMGNGQVERLNRTLISMLKSIPEKEKKNWKVHLPKLMFAYNSTVNKTTGFSPYFLLFGRESHLPIDSIFPVEAKQLNNKTYAKFVDNWQSAMKEAFEIANEKIKKTAEYNKKYYDSKIKYVEVNVGDKVLLKNKETGGPGKLRSFWERKIYEVIWKDDVVPVYTVRGLGEKKTKNVHRNLMMKANDLPLDTFAADQAEGPPRKPRTRRVSFHDSDDKDESSSSDSELEAVAILCPRELLEGEGAGTERQHSVQELPRNPPEEIGDQNSATVPEILGSDTGEPFEEEETGDTLISDVDDIGTEQYDSEEDTVVNLGLGDSGERDDEEMEDLLSTTTEDTDQYQSAVEEVREEEELSSESDSEMARPTTRKTARPPRPRRVFTYDEVGGRPKTKDYHMNAHL